MTIDYSKEFVRTQSLSIDGVEVTATAAELNILDGVTATAAELNILDGVTSTANELNILDGVTSSTAELNIFDGVTATAAELNIMDGVTATAAELNTLDLSVVGGAVKIKKLPITVVAAATEQDTGWDLPAKALVLDVFAYVTTAEATGGTKTVDIGTNGSGSDDPDGFADALSVASTGFVRPQAAVTAGGSETYFSANTRGVLLSNYIAGTNADGDFGLYREKPDGTSGGESVTYTLGSADFAELVADLYIVFIELP